MTAIADFTSIATTLLGRTPTQQQLLKVGDAVAAVDPLNLGGWFDQWKIVSGYEIVNSGSGYAVDDILLVEGGSGTSVIFRVEEVSSGEIVTLSFESEGNYSVFPTSPVSVIGGSGTGATLNLFSMIQSAVREPTNEEKAQLCLDTMKKLIVNTVKQKARQDKINELDVNRDSEIETAENTAATDFS